MSKKKAVKRPAFQFYPGDWLRSTDLRSCSIGARGLWIDMICLMHEGNPYGHLKVNQKVIHPENLCRMVGETFQDVSGWIEELKSSGVVSITDDGCLFSRRMVKDENTRNIRAEGGKKGGNPVLLAIAAANEEQDERLTSKVNQEITPAIALASASAPSGIDQEQSATPHVADAPPSQKRPSRKKDAMPLTDWLTACREQERKPIPDDDPIRSWADEAGIPEDYMRLAWKVFTRDWAAKKPQKDWPSVFRDAIRRNWLKLWYADRETGECKLTAAGELERKAHE